MIDLGADRQRIAAWPGALAYGDRQRSEAADAELAGAAASALGRLARRDPPHRLGHRPAGRNEAAMQMGPAGQIVKE